MRIRLARKITALGLLAGLLTVSFGASASAHVVVKPGEVKTAEFQTFTIGVPNEKDIPTTSIKLAIPAGLKYVQPTQKEGWQIDVQKEGDGESATVTAITWSGNEVKPGFRDDFTFSAQVPDKTGELQWKAYQMYSDGAVVSWDKAESAGDHDADTSGPFSVTKVVRQTADDAASIKAEKAATDAKNLSTTALIVGSIGIITGLVGIFFATRKSK